MSPLHALQRAPTPDAPGPGPMPDALLRALDMRIGRRVNGLLTGDYRSALQGDGTELAQIRPYVPGDDPRRMDWNVTARTDEPHVRVHVAERALETWLVLDTSASMTFGTADRRKADVAAGVALGLGHVATRRGNRLGAVTFGDSHPRAVPARQGRMGLLGLLTALREEGEIDENVGATSLGKAAVRAGAMARQRALVVVVSDFRGDPDWRKPLLGLAARHDVHRRRDSRPARAGAAECRPALARRSRDRPAAPRRHAQRQAPRAVRRGRRRRSGASWRGHRHARRSATTCSAPHGEDRLRARSPSSSSEAPR